MANHDFIVFETYTARSRIGVGLLIKVYDLEPQDSGE
jgi:hypothetical protein